MEQFSIDKNQERLMKKFSIKMRRASGGYEKAILWSEDIDTAVESAKKQIPMGYKLTKVEEVRPTAEDLWMIEGLGWKWKE